MIHQHNHQRMMATRMLTKTCGFLSRVNASRIIYLVILIYSMSLIYTYNTRLYKIRAQRKDLSYLNHKSMKYILLWTNRFREPLDTMGEGNSVFVKGKCKYINCFVTDDKNYFINQSDFDAIAFSGRDAIHLWSFQMPSNRSPKQKYIFAASESADNFPACGEILDGFFNWTWTYRLDSDLHWGYIIISDMEGNVVGPSINMKWRDSFDPIDEELKRKLATKSKAAAWFVSRCTSKGGRERFVENMQGELKAFGWSIDIYGACGTLSCPRSEENSCFRMVEKQYYFYLSFENSFSEDYVTEKLLTALNNYAVPVVYGAADYSRFLPPGSYLDARELGPKQLARRMSEIIGNTTMYHDFFRWRNHYVYRESSPPEEVCKLCKMLNDEEKVSQVTVCNDFRTWWNGARYKHNCG